MLMTGSLSSTGRVTCHQLGISPQDIILLIFLSLQAGPIQYVYKNFMTPVVVGTISSIQLDYTSVARRSMPREASTDPRKFNIGYTGGQWEDKCALIGRKLLVRHHYTRAVLKSDAVQNFLIRRRGEER